MKKLIILFFTAFIISCSSNDDGGNVMTSTVSYHVEGSGSIYKLQYTDNPITGSTDPRTNSPGEIFNATLPLVVTINDYTPHKIEAFVMIDDLSDREYIDRIYIKKDGKIVDEASFFDLDQVNTFGDGIYSVHLIYSW